MNDMKVISCTKEIAGKIVTLETGKVARQATGSVIASSGDTKVLVTVVAGQDKPGQGFFPLTVNYIEKFYASGKIPGSFFRREGRPSEKEVLTSRLIDRPIRPLFPKGYSREVQIICTVLSMDKNDDADAIFAGLTFEEVGPGSVSLGMASTDTSEDDFYQYELSYSYPLNDGMTITPGLFIAETAGDDETGVVVTTSFSF